MNSCSYFDTKELYHSREAKLPRVVPKIYRNRNRKVNPSYFSLHVRPVMEEKKHVKWILVRQLRWLVQTPIQKTA